jgi:hypothetical protein
MTTDGAGPHELCDPVRVPVVSPYALTDLPAAQAELRELGVDPANVTLACAAGQHDDCPGRVEQKRRCECPTCGPGHGTRRRR